MRELAVQSSNDTNTAQDRAELQKEMDQLSQEITRISTDTEFNTRKLLNGDLSGSSNAVTFHIGANSSQNIKLEIAELDAEALDVAGLSGASTALTGIAGATVSNRTGEDLTIKYEAVDTNPSGKAVTQTTATMSNDGKTVTIKLAQEAGGTITASNQDVVDALKQLGSLSVKETGTITGSATVQADQTVNKATSVTEKTGIDISTQGAADKAISTIDKALSKVSNERSKLGAVQNRLEHTINNLGTSSENLTAAESRIRDTDMAAEMMAFTKNNILMQAAQSMLAQANQQPQGVLQLLG